MQRDYEFGHCWYLNLIYMRAYFTFYFSTFLLLYTFDYLNRLKNNISITLVKNRKCNTNI